MAPAVQMLNHIAFGLLDNNKSGRAFEIVRL